MTRVAVFIHGGIGGGFYSQGQPPIQQLVTRLAQVYEMEIYSLRPPGKDFIPPGFTIVHPPWQGWSWAGWAYLTLMFCIRNIRNPCQALYSFWGYPAGGFAVGLGQLFGIPSIVHLQGGDAAGIRSLKYGVFLHPLRAAICRSVYAKCSRLIVLSEYQAVSLRSNGVDREAMIIPYGPDTSSFTFMPERLKQPVVRFLHVANQTPVKGQEMMLKVFSIVSKSFASRLVMVGADYYQGKLKDWCVDLEIEDKVSFLGPQPHERMPELYHNADILLHTPEYEGQGMVFAEAAACGTLIAGTEVGMLSDMGHACALIVKPGQYQVLAEKIAELLSSRIDYRPMQRKAREWIEEKDVNYTVAELSHVLSELIPYVDPERPKKSSRKAER